MISLFATSIWKYHSFRLRLPAQAVDATPSSALILKYFRTVVNQQRFFLRLGERIRELRRKNRHSQEDMISGGFSARHWQQIEAGRPITVSILLRICAVFETLAERLIHGLDRGIYED